MKRLLLAFLFTWGLQLINAQENYIQINGSTNVNNFKCTNNSFKNNGEYQLSNSNLPNITLKVNDFDCQHKIMTKDFQKTLASDKFPNLSIKFLKVSKENNGYTAQIQVGMMDKIKNYSVNFSTEKEKLIGKKQVKFSEFGIQPPKKMGGMIVVKDELNLIFSLNAK